jgi:hypothetical protein
MGMVPPTIKQTCPNDLLRVMNKFRYTVWTPDNSIADKEHLKKKAEIRRNAQMPLTLSPRRVEMENRTAEGSTIALMQADHICRIGTTLPASLAKPSECPLLIPNFEYSTETLYNRIMVLIENRSDVTILYAPSDIENIPLAPGPIFAHSFNLFSMWQPFAPEDLLLYFTSLAPISESAYIVVSLLGKQRTL